MAYTDLTSTFVYKLLLTWQLMDQLAENDAMMIRTTGGQTITPATTVTALVIDQNQSVNGLIIDHDGATGWGLGVYGKLPGYFAQDKSSGRALLCTRNLNDTGAQPLVIFQEDHVTSTQPVLQIINDGSGEPIIFTPSVTRYLSISPADLVQVNTTTPALITQNGFQSASDTALTSGVCGVHLPNGAVVTAFLVFWYRDDTNAAATADLHQYDGAGNDTEMAAADSASTAGYYSVEDTTISPDTINNVSYNYGIRVDLDPNDSKNDCVFHGARITYNITEPLP